jgi:hypothetical protein
MPTIYDAKIFEIKEYTKLSKANNKRIQSNKKLRQKYKYMRNNAITEKNIQFTIDTCEHWDMINFLICY